MNKQFDIMKAPVTAQSYNAMLTQCNLHGITDEIVQYFDISVKEMCNILQLLLRSNLTNGEAWQALCFVPVAIKEEVARRTFRETLDYCIELSMTWSTNVSNEVKSKFC